MKTAIKKFALFFLLISISIVGIIVYFLRDTQLGTLYAWQYSYNPVYPKIISESKIKFLTELSSVAIEQTYLKVTYIPDYQEISYPNGDIPENQGVCSDVIIRAYRKLTIDLQKDVHEDMEKHFDLYPRIWGLKKTDTNIDHRRVPNLMVFFKRKGIILPITKQKNDYLPGDIITWNLAFGRPHIGIVINRKNKISANPLIVHNIGDGPQIEDVLFNWEITGHFRYFGLNEK